jgi:hypothetical protein
MQNARWHVVAVRRPVRQLVVRVLGPDGTPPVTVIERTQASTVRVLTVAGARAIEVELDGDVRRYELPCGDLVID